MKKSLKPKSKPKSSVGPKKSKLPKKISKKVKGKKAKDLRAAEWAGLVSNGTYDEMIARNMPVGRAEAVAARVMADKRIDKLIDEYLISEMDNEGPTPMLSTDTMQNQPQNVVQIKYSLWYALLYCRLFWHVWWESPNGEVCFWCGKQRKDTK